MWSEVSGPAGITGGMKREKVKWILGSDSSFGNRGNRIAIGYHIYKVDLGVRFADVAQKLADIRGAAGRGRPALRAGLVQRVEQAWDAMQQSPVRVRQSAVQ